MVRKLHVFLRGFKNNKNAQTSLWAINPPDALNLDIEFLIRSGASER